MHHVSEDIARHYIRTSVYKPRRYRLSANNFAVNTYRVTQYKK
jgi:hypothetical protein